jgi:hypothetical protein
VGPVVLILIALAFAAAACGIEPVSERPQTEHEYPDVVSLFDRAIAPTCSLNNGVCHNSNNYPDLHTPAAIVATLDEPCNVELEDPALVHDACEPAADHLVIASAGIDARIVDARLLDGELGNSANDLTQITLTLDPAPGALAPGATDTVVQRGDTRFSVGEYGAKVSAVQGSEVTLDLTSAYGEWTAKRFFDVRVYPPGPLRLHVGDPNRNGVQGALVMAMPLVTAGDPDRSFMLKRLVDPAYGELMPRQCRTWNDAANLALACWIAGLAPDASNAFEPIDYDACTAAVAGLGKCE